MNKDNDNILEDLEANDAAEVTGGNGPQFSVNAMGQEAGMKDNTKGGSTIKAGGATVETHENHDGSSSIQAEHGERKAKLNYKV